MYLRHITQTLTELGMHMAHSNPYSDLIGPYQILVMSQMCIDPLHEHEKTVKLRILSSNDRHVVVQRSLYGCISER